MRRRIPAPPDVPPLTIPLEATCPICGVRSGVTVPPAFDVLTGTDASGPFQQIIPHEHHTMVFGACRHTVEVAEEIEITGESPITT